MNLPKYFISKLKKDVFNNSRMASKYFKNVFEKLQNGSLNLQEELLVSKKAWKFGGSKMFVKVGDRVYTHTGNLKPVIDTLGFDRSEAITVINDIECTSNHEFYVVNREDVELINENNIHEYAKWIAAYDLDEQQHLLIKTLE